MTNPNPNPNPDPGYGRTLVRVAWLAWSAFVIIWASVSTAVWLSTGDLGSFIGGGIVVVMTALIPVGVTLVAPSVDGPSS